MKKFEVGKFYENNNIFGDTIMTWQCTRINNNRATFKLVRYRYTKDHGKSYAVVNALDPYKILSRICKNEYRDTEEAYNDSQIFYLEANREAI